MDSGPILAQHSVSIDEFITIERAFEALTLCYVRCLTEVLSMSHELSSRAKSQDASKATYSIWRDDDDFQIRWSKSAVPALQEFGQPGATGTQPEYSINSDYGSTSKLTQ